jgi:hypothetical protein
MEFADHYGRNGLVVASMWWDSLASKKKSLMATS